MGTGCLHVEPMPSPPSAPTERYEQCQNLSWLLQRCIILTLTFTQSLIIYITYIIYIYYIPDSVNSREVGILLIYYVNPSRVIVC